MINTATMLKSVVGVAKLATTAIVSTATVTAAAATADSEHMLLQVLWTSLIWEWDISVKVTLEKVEETNILQLVKAPGGILSFHNGKSENSDTDLVNF